MCMFLQSYPIEQFVTFEIVTNVTSRHGHTSVNW